jgi:hypothetical protein
MQIPILSMPRIRQLVEQGKLYGFGVDTDAIPTEDIFGRICRNNDVELNPPGDWQPEYITFSHCSLDPVLEEDEIEAIDTTRRWFDSFLDEQMGKDGDLYDPTDYPNKIRIIKR